MTAALRLLRRTSRARGPGDGRPETPRFALRRGRRLRDRRLRRGGRHAREGTVDRGLRRRRARAGTVPAASDFMHDELGVFFHHELMGGGPESDVRRPSGRTRVREATRPPRGRPPSTRRRSAARSVHFSGQLLALPPSRFRRAQPARRRSPAPVSRTGRSATTSWSPTTRRSTGRSACPARPARHDPPRSKPYPLPPLPVKSSARPARARREASSGCTASPAPHRDPVAAPQRPRRPACTAASAWASAARSARSPRRSRRMIPLAEASGRCEIRPESTVFRIEHRRARPRQRGAVLRPRRARAAQRAKAVVLAPTARETPRLLLHVGSRRASRTGLANSSGFVGKHLMFNGHAVGARRLRRNRSTTTRACRCTRIVLDFYETDPARGFYGGGGIDARPLWSATPILHRADGHAARRAVLGRGVQGRARAQLHAQDVRARAAPPRCRSSRNNITLDPQSQGPLRPAGASASPTDDHATTSRRRSSSWRRRWRSSMRPAPKKAVGDAGRGRQSGGAHLLGTCRMGDDPETSVVDRYHRSHDVPNLFICDGSSLVTSGPRPAHHDHHGAGLSRRRPNPRRRSGQSHLGVPPMRE